jgi:hypothetical protein
LAASDEAGLLVVEQPLAPKVWSVPYPETSRSLAEYRVSQMRSLRLIICDILSLRLKVSFLLMSFAYSLQSTHGCPIGSYGVRVMDFCACDLLCGSGNATLRSLEPNWMEKES